MTEEPVRLAHLGRKNAVTEGYVEGTPVTALCGDRFVPSRDPERLPDCEDCERMLGLLELIIRWRAEMDEDERAAATCELCGAPLLPSLEFCIGCRRPVEPQD